MSTDKRTYVKFPFGGTIRTELGFGAVGLMKLRPFPAPSFVHIKNRWPFLIRKSHLFIDPGLTLELFPVKRLLPPQEIKIVRYKRSSSFSVQSESMINHNGLFPAFIRL